MSAEKSPLRSFEETEAFVQLFTTHQRRIFMFILALVSHPADAEEVLQETNLVLWRKFDQFRLGSDFRAWACEIARYEVLKFRTRTNRGPGSVHLSDDVVEQLAEDAASHTDFLEQRRLALIDCLKKLSATDRDLIERRLRSGVTMATIAAEVDRPVGGLYKAFERIYRALHQCIDHTLAEEGSS